MKKLILFIIIVTLTFSFINNSLRKISEIKVGNFTLEYILKVHNDGMKQLDISKKNDNIDFIRNELSAYLQKNHLSIDYLKEADFSNADLKNLDFRFLNLKESKLVNSDLSNSNLQGVNLKESNLTGANLSDTNLKDANLKEATVKNAIFSNAILTNADIHEAQGLSIRQLLTCKSLLNTSVPEDLFISIKKEKPELLK